MSNKASQSDFNPFDAYGRRKKYSVDPEEFAKRYAKNSDVAISFLIEHEFLIVACDCGEDDCLGWQMQTKEWLDTRKELGLWDDATKMYWVKDVYLGETPEEYYALHYPDIDKETLEMCLSMDAASPVAYYTCICGRQHEVEYNPPEHNWSSSGNICACGHEIKFGE